VKGWARKSQKFQVQSNLRFLSSQGRQDSLIEEKF